MRQPLLSISTRTLLEVWGALVSTKCRGVYDNKNTTEIYPQTFYQYSQAPCGSSYDDSQSVEILVSICELFVEMYNIPITIDGNSPIVWSAKNATGEVSFKDAVCITVGHPPED